MTEPVGLIPFSMLPIEHPRVSAAVNWIREFIAGEHGSDSNTRILCPWARRAIREDCLYFEVVGGDASDLDLTSLAYRLADALPTLEPRSGPWTSNRLAGALFTGRDTHALAEAVDQVHHSLVELFLARGLVLGGMHILRTRTAARDANLYTMRCPTPILAVRLLVPQDISLLGRSGFPGAAQHVVIAQAALARSGHDGTAPNLTSRGLT